MADEPPPTLEDTVGDDELLYRRVRKDCIGRDTDNKPFYHSTAFNDRYLKPSVDRAHINRFDPQPTRFDETNSDAVVSLIASRVRAIKSVMNHNAPGNASAPHVIDVLPSPVRNHPTLPDNPAHAQIQATDPITDTAFGHLRKALAKMSTPVLAPYEPVVYLTTTRKVYHVRTCRHVSKGWTAVAFTKIPAGARHCCGCRPADWTPDAATEPAGGA
jgi:hypothetical protein